MLTIFHRLQAAVDTKDIKTTKKTKSNKTQRNNNNLKNSFLIIILNTICIQNHLDINGNCWWFLSWINLHLLITWKTIQWSNNNKNKQSKINKSQECFHVFHVTIKMKKTWPLLLHWIFYRYRHQFANYVAWSEGMKYPKWIE